METITWNDDLTKLVKMNLGHQSWQTIATKDMLIACKFIEDNPGVPKDEVEKQLKQELRVGNTNGLRLLEGLYFLESADFYKLSETPTDSNRNYYYTGKELHKVILEDSLSSDDAVCFIAHNFMLIARESLELCDYLTTAGVTKQVLREKFENHLVFTNKLNPFKFDNILDVLVNLKILTKEGDRYTILYSPAPLTFYCMIEKYLAESNYSVGARISCDDIKLGLDMCLPKDDKRSENYKKLSLSKNPLEGWESPHYCWMTPESFQEILKIGLIHPTSVAKILCKITLGSDKDKVNIAKKALEELKQDLVEKCKKFHSPFVGFDKILKEFDCG